MRLPDVPYGPAFRYGSYLVIAALAVNAVRLSVMTPVAQSVRVVPYTAVLAETIVAQNGASRQGPVQTWALRSDGSTFLRIGPAGSGATIVFGDGTQVITSPRLGARSSVRISQDLRDRLRDPAAGCAASLSGRPVMDGEAVVGEETIAGYRAAKVTLERAGVRTDLWYAVDAGCAPLKIVMDFGGAGRSEQQLVTLDRGDPNAELFVVDGLREGPPSLLADRPDPCDAACAAEIQKRFEKRDQIYFALRAKYAK